MFLFRGGDAKNLITADPQAWQDHMMKWKSWMGELAGKGKMLAGEPLTPNEGKVLAGKAKKMTDGPFVEGKEIIGGYLIVEAKDLNEAAELSKGCPIFEHDGTVEVRTVQEIPA